MSKKNERDRQLREANETGRKISKKLALTRSGAITLDEDLIEAFCKYLRLGRPKSTICDLLSLPQHLIVEWLDKSTLYDKTGDKKYAVYRLFEMETRRAASEYLCIVKDKQEQYPAGEWQKFAWILERRDPKNWSRDASTEDVSAGTSQAGNDQFL